MSFQSRYDSSSTPLSKRSFNKAIVFDYAKTGITGVYLTTVAMSVLLFGSTSTPPLIVASMCMCFVGLATSLVSDVPKHLLPYYMLTAVTLGCVLISGFLQSYSPPGFQPFAGLIDQPGFWTAGALSAVPGDSKITLLAITYPLLTFMVGLHLCGTTKGAKKWLVSAAFLGTVVASVGIIQFIFWPTTLMLGPKTAYIDSLTGSFVNRNSAATFLGVTLVLLVFLSWQNLNRTREQGINRRVTDPFRSLLSLKVVALAATILVVLTSLVLTKSRGGVGATFFALFLLCGILSLRSIRLNAPSHVHWRNVLGVASATIVACLLIAILGDRVFVRMLERGLEDSRFCVAPSIFAAGLSNWVFGYGFGSFQSLFPTFRDPACGIVGVWNHAHNFFLEGFFEAGIGFVVIAGVCIAALAFAFVQAGLSSTRRGPYGVLGASILLLLVSHSLVDFSLQTPGIASFCAVVFAALISVCTNADKKNFGRHSVGKSRLLYSTGDQRPT